MNQTVKGKGLPFGANQDPVGFGETGKVCFIVIRQTNEHSRLNTHIQNFSTT